MRRSNSFLRFAMWIALLTLGTTVGFKEGGGFANGADKSAEAAKKGTTEQPGKIVPLNKQGTVLLDAAGKRVLLKTTVVLREGTLEMLCCLKQTKEHEAILSLDAKAYVVHTALLAIGAEPGKPAEFFPDYVPATGQRIDIFLQWKDEKGNLQRVPAQKWIRNVTHRYFAEKLEKLPPEVKLSQDTDLRYDPTEHELFWYGPMDAKQKQELLAMSKDAAYRRAIESIAKRGESREMTAHWIFPGSGFDEFEGQRAYRAEIGDLICVANFASATLDVSTQSGQGADELLFEAYTERIPPRDTEVTVELIPVFDKDGAEKKSPPGEKPASSKGKSGKTP